MMQSARPVILIVGGWSPGPLMYLKSFLSSHRCSILEPRNLPMPPFPGSWCCDPKVMAMFIVLIVLLWMSSRIHHYAPSVLWNVVAVVAALVWVRLLALVVVRSSIRKSIQICLEVIRQQEEGNVNVIVIGFSWGAAVLAEMLAKEMIGGTDQPSALLIAPTTSLVASVAMEKDAALRVGQVSNNGSVHVVHGTADSAFCPHQERWNTAPGVTLHRVHDNHVFFQRSSQRTLVEILDHLLRAAETSAD